MRVSIFLILLFSALGHNNEEPTCANAPGLWDNWFANLEALFWRPWLDQYRVVRYATGTDFPIRLKWDEKQVLSKSCLDLGLTDWRSLVLIHWTAWAPSPQFGPWSFLVQNAPPMTQRALETLRICSHTTFASRKETMSTLNMTLQNEGHCAFATKSLRCAIGNLYWLLSYAAIGFMVTVTVVTLASLVGLMCCIWGLSFVNGRDGESTTNEEIPME